MPGMPIGQVTCASSACAKAARLQAVAKGRPLGLAADQADVGQIALRALAAQAGGHDVQVFGMAEAHDQHRDCRRQARHRAVAPGRSARRPRPRAAGRGRCRRGCRSRSAQTAAAPAPAPAPGPHGRRQTAPQGAAGATGEPADRRPVPGRQQSVPQSPGTPRHHSTAPAQGPAQNASAATRGLGWTHRPGGGEPRRWPAAPDARRRSCR